MQGRLLKTFSIFAVLVMLAVSMAAIALPDNDVDAVSSDNSAATIRFEKEQNSSEYVDMNVRIGYPVQLPTSLFSVEDKYLDYWTDGTNNYDPGYALTVESGMTLYGVWASGTGNHLQDVTLEPGERYNKKLKDLTGNTGTFEDIVIPDEWMDIIVDQYTWGFADTYLVGNAAGPDVYYISFSQSINGINPTFYWFTITVEAETDKEVEVNFRAGEETTEYFDTRITRAGTGFILPGEGDVPSTGHENETLVGWSLKDDRGTPGTYALDSLYIFDVDTVVTAVWEADPNILIYSLDGGSLDNVYAEIIESDKPVTFKTGAFKDGYKFLGWMVNEDPDMVYAPGLMTYLDSMTKVRAYFVPEDTLTYTVEFDAGKGSTLIQSQTVEPGKYIVLPTLQTSLDGYEFAGWSTEPPTGDGIDDRSTIGERDYQVTGNVKLYAVYTDPSPTDPDEPEDPDDPEPEPLMCTVYFDSQGGDLSYEPVKTLSGQTIQAPASPVKDGSIFLGWAKIGTAEAYDFTKPIESSTTFYALWGDLFTISYGSDAATGLPTVTVNVLSPYNGSPNISVYWGSTEAGSGVVVNGTATKVYEYTTWGYISITVEWEGQDHTSRMPFSVKAEHYNPVRVHTVWFDTDEGSYLGPQFVDHGSTITRPADPTKDGMNFAGWVGPDGKPWDFDRPIYYETTLRATWADTPVVEDPETDIVPYFTVSKTTDGWKLDGSKSVNVKTYEWYLDDEAVGTGVTFELKAENVADGNHTVQLKCIGNDDKEYWTDKQTITKGDVVIEPVIPVASVSKSETDTTWEFDGTGSSNSIKYQWYVDGEKIAGATSFKFSLQKEGLAAGLHTIKLEVQSTTGHTDTATDSFQITGNGGNSGDDDGSDWVLYVCIAALVIVIIVAVWRFI